MHFTGSVSLRPVRVGFLVPPDDLSIVSRVARLSACLWGGRYNPIIPFFESGGDRWRRPYSDAKGIEVAQGYVNFFEPDVLVETTPGMANKPGWEDTHRTMGLPRVISLNQFTGLRTWGLRSRTHATMPCRTSRYRSDVVHRSRATAAELRGRSHGLV